MTQGAMEPQRPDVLLLFSQGSSTQPPL